MIVSSAETRRDLDKFLDLMIQGRGLIVAIVLIFAVAGAALAFLMRPIYRASVVLYPAESGNSANGITSMLGDLGGLASLAGVKLGANSGSTEAIALLQSRQFTDAFIADEGLMPKLYSSRWDIERHAWRPSLWFDPPTAYDAYRRFDEKIRSVSEDKKTSLVTLTIDWSDATEGARWANLLVARLNETMQRRAISEADATIALLDTELQANIAAPLQQAIGHALEAQIKNRALARVQPDYVFRVVDPAQPSDRKKFVRPQRALYLISGPIVGFIFAIFVLAIRNFINRYSMERRASVNHSES